MDKNNNSSNFNINLSKTAKNRILEIQTKAENKNKHLRISVLGGGCSGFQYNFKLDDKINDDDFKLNDGKKILVTIDSVSLDFLNNCSIDYVDELGGSFFKIDNPNAAASCGCGNSFST